jgi:hypothetical protein
MLSFNQFYDKLNGKMYQDIPPPVSYDFLDYVKGITSTPVNNTEQGTWRLIPIEADDMKRYAADDVADHYSKMHKGNPLALGEPLSDGEFKKFCGITW